MSQLIKLIAADEVPAGAMVEIESDGHTLLVANAGGTFYVADGRCPHLGGHLAEGVLEGTIVTCPRHHSQFDLSDGHVVRWTDFTGAVLTIAELARHPRPLRVFEAAVVDGFVSAGPEKSPVVTP